MSNLTEEDVAALVSAIRVPVAVVPGLIAALQTLAGDDP